MCPLSCFIILFKGFYNDAFMAFRQTLYLFGVLEIAPKSRAKVCAQWIILKRPVADRSRAMILMSFLHYVYCSDVSCCIS